MALRAGQSLKTIQVDINSSGTARRIITNPDDENRFMRSGYFCPAFDNASAIYIGDENVSSTFYMDLLIGQDKDRITIKGDLITQQPDNRFNYWDLYNTWVDGDNNGDVLFVTILEA